MGLIGRLVGAGAVTDTLQAAGQVVDALRPNATKKMEAAHRAYVAALDEYGTEFRTAQAGWFDRMINGLNRLPRPLLAFGTLGLFVYAMIDPAGFARRMVGLNFVPEPLWWLLAAIVGFYFGAREAHYFRTPAAPRAGADAAVGPAPAAAARSDGRDDNPALRELARRTTTSPPRDK